MRDGNGAWPVDVSTALGMALRRARTKYSCSLRDLAKRGGVSVSFLSRVETAQERAPDHVLTLYADSFRVDVDELFRLAGRVHSDVAEHLVENPKAVRKIRAEIERKSRQEKNRPISGH